MIPDRGWNRQGTVNFHGRLHRFDITLNPLYTGTTTSQNRAQDALQGLVLFHQIGGLQTTGLDPTGVRPANPIFPDLPIGSNGLISVDNETVVHVGDGTIWVSDEYGPYIYHYTENGHCCTSSVRRTHSSPCGSTHPAIPLRISLPTARRSV